MLSDRVHQSPSYGKARRRRKTSKEERVCAVCGQAFKKAEHLARHFRSHTKEKPFECHVCSKSFARQDTLLRHSRCHATDREDSDTQPASIQSDYNGCLDPNLMSQISITTGAPTVPFHAEMTNDMISPPSSASIDKQTPEFPISEHSYPSQVTPLTSFFSLETSDAWRNQGSPQPPPLPPPPLWDSQLDQEWETLLTGDDFDLNAVNMSLLSATSQYMPTTEMSAFDMEATSMQPLPVDLRAKQHSITIQRKWHTFCEMSSSGEMTPDISHEQSCMDENYRKRLADRLQQRVQTGILPSTPFLDLCIQAYFSKFHPLFPVVHMATFRPGTQNSVLLLSICSVGSLFVGSSRAVNHGISMFERLNKAILASWDTYTFKSGGSSLVALQASIIGQTFGLLLGRPKDLTGIEVFHGSIIAWARKAKLFNNKPPEYNFLLNNTDGPALEETWKDWAQYEVKQRIILGLHIHDALFARIHNHEPILRHSVDRLPQVSSNELFTASSAENWKALMIESHNSNLSSPKQGVNDFAMFATLESISAISSEDQDRDYSPLNQDWLTTRERCHALLTDFHTKYYSRTITSKTSPSWSWSWSWSWPCNMILWHSIFINLYANINVLECACGREGYGLSQMHASSVRSWIQSPDAKRALLHAMLLQRTFEALPAGAEPAIHVPLSLYHCGIVWACFLHFDKLDGGQQGDKGDERSPSVSLSADDARHFEELHLPGVDGIGVLEQLGTVSPGRLALGSLFRIIDLLQRINHFKVSQSLATTLLALVEEMQGLF